MKMRVAIVDDKFSFEHETQLTVHKTSLFFAGDGFVAYDQNGNLLFRFDSYGPHSHQNDQLLLMDASGTCLLNLLRKKPSLYQRWEGFVGEKTDAPNPIFRMYRSSIIGRSAATVQLYCDPSQEYLIGGSYSRRCRKIYSTSSGDTSRYCVAEIERKVDPTTNVMLGKDVVWLSLQPVFDAAFAMGLILILDQMYDDDDDVVVDLAPPNYSLSKPKKEQAYSKTINLQNFQCARVL